MGVTGALSVVFALLLPLSLGEDVAGVSPKELLVVVFGEPSNRYLGLMLFMRQVCGVGAGREGEVDDLGGTTSSNLPPLAGGRVLRPALDRSVRQTRSRTHLHNRAASYVHS